MTQDRIANWGESESAARYQTGDDDPDGGDFIVARDLDGQRMLLKFDFTANEWQYAGDVDMGGGDINSVGTARVDALEAEQLLTEFDGAELRTSNSFEIADDTLTDIEFETVERDKNGFADLVNNQIVIPSNDYSLAFVSFELDVESAGMDLELCRLLKNGDEINGGLFRTNNPRDFRAQSWSVFGIEVSENDAISVDLRHLSGEPRELRDLTKFRVSAI